MDGWGVLEQAAELRRRGQAFALATVVWRQGPSSGQQGSRAIITADGELHGWIGGACAEPAVLREARQVIAAGAAAAAAARQPRAVCQHRAVWQPAQFAARQFASTASGSTAQSGAVPDGMVLVPISCQSEGALEVYIEPVLPAPRLVVVGRSPMASTLTDLAGRSAGARS